jgi:hypothetical protein
VRKALRIPAFTIASNAGEDAQEVVTKIMQGSGNFGFDAMNGQYVDMLEAGIIDPTKVRKLLHFPYYYNKSRAQHQLFELLVCWACTRLRLAARKSFILVQCLK